LGKDQHEEKSNGYDDEDHPSGEVQSISQLHQGSPKVKWRTLLGGSHVKSQKEGERKVNEADANFYGGTQ